MADTCWGQPASRSWAPSLAFCYLKPGRFESKEITETLTKHAHKPANYTYIVFEQVAHEDWAIGGQLLG